jgi:hypothetical protein
MSHARLKPLTPHQEADARAQAYTAFLKEMEIRHPRPEPSTGDLVHDNPTIAKALGGSISLMPLFLAGILVSSMLISADKTFKAFSGAAANRGWFWTTLIGVLGIVMTEGAMVYVAFAKTRQRLQKGLPRQVVTLPSLVRGIKVRLGLAPVPDYDQLPDSSLAWFSRLIFVLILAANIFTATLPLLKGAGPVMTLVDWLELVFAVFMGAVAPFALHSVGSQMAHLSFELFQETTERLKRELDEQWHGEMDQRWAAVEEELTRRALHRQYLVVNRLEGDAPSPYLLVSGEEGEVQAVPFERSLTPSDRR